MARKDYYQVLGVDKKASQREIQRAFRRLAREHHPDVNPSRKDAAERFKEVNEAYQVLSDPEQRKRYDENGQSFRFTGPTPQGYGPFRWTFEREEPPSGRPFGMEADPFGNILEDLLRSRGKAPFRGAFGAPRPARVEHPVEITLEEAFHGTTRLIELMERDACPNCGGKGESCPQCGGLGVIQRPRRLEVKVPPGVSTGSRIRVSPNRGREGVDGGGEILLVVNVLPHDRFTREGDDLHVEVPVPFLDAVLGGEVEVKTIGKSVALKIPAATQNGQSFRLKGQGMPAFGRPGTGDLYAKVKVSMPTDLSEEELSLFRRFKELRRKRGVR